MIKHCGQKQLTNEFTFVYDSRGLESVMGGTHIQIKNATFLINWMPWLKAAKTDSNCIAL